MRDRFDVKSAIAVAAFLFFLIPTHGAQEQEITGNAKSAKDAAAKAKPTPRLANGHPDLNGVWYPWAGHVTQGEIAGNGETEKDGSVIALYDQNRALAARAAGQTNVVETPRRNPMPPYKPELVAKVNDLEVHQNRLDPVYKCVAPGVPRIGPPQEIIQSDKKVVFIYSDVAGNFWRIVPTDGRPHNADADPSFLGDSIGHWEGDTLVVDDTNFNDETWLSNSGTFHTEALRVTERLTRQGDSLRYEVTVEDPKAFTGPWVLKARTLDLSDVPLEEAPPCKDMDQSHFVTLGHH